MTLISFIKWASETFGNSAIYHPNQFQAFSVSRHNDIQIYEICPYKWTNLMICLTMMKRWKRKIETRFIGWINQSTKIKISFVTKISLIILWKQTNKQKTKKEKKHSIEISPNKYTNLPITMNLKLSSLGWRPKPLWRKLCVVRY